MMPLYRWLLLLPLFMLLACEGQVAPTELEMVDLGRAEGCDAAEQPCQLTGEGVTLRLDLASNIRTLQPFQLQLHVEGGQASTIEEVMVEFFMEGMDMGVNRYRLLSDTGGWHGEIILPVCVAGRGDWYALVELRGQQRRYQARFPFHSSG